MRRHGLSERGFWVALAVSVLIHAAALLRLPLHLPVEKDEERRPGEALTVTLAPPSLSIPLPAPPPAPASQAQRPAASAPRAPRAAPRPQPRDPVLALNQPAPEPLPATPPAPAPAVTPPTNGDLSSFIEARRRARAATEPPAAPSEPHEAAHAEDETARANRIASANIGANRKPTFGSDSTRGYGVFDLRRVTYDYAEFVFFGWNREINRNTTQLVEVRRGNDGDIRIAVVRRMIAIIREREEGDFVFESRRLGRNVTLSARAQDNSGLEDFMLREFFSATLPN